MRSGESGGVGCSSGLIERCVLDSLRSRLSGMATCCGDSCCFPVLGDGCDSFQDGPPSRVNSSCFSTKGTVQIGGIRGNRDDDVIGVDDFVSGESSFCFPVAGDGWDSFHSGGVDLSLDNVLESGCLGNKGFDEGKLIETIRG